MIQKLKISILAFLMPLLLTAQASEDFLRSTGKIYSVVAAVLIMFIGIVIYLIRLDRKISKLEQEHHMRN